MGTILSSGVWLRLKANAVGQIGGQTSTASMGNDIDRQGIFIIGQHLL